MEYQCCQSFNKELRCALPQEVADWDKERKAPSSRQVPNAITDGFAGRGSLQRATTRQEKRHITLYMQVWPFHICCSLVLAQATISHRQGDTRYVEEKMCYDRYVLVIHLFGNHTWQQWQKPRCSNTKTPYVREIAGEALKSWRC